MRKKPDKKQQIKSVFMSLNQDHKIEARERIAKKFDVAIESVNNRWMYEGKIPEKYVEGVSKIMKAVAKKQLNQLTKMYELI